MKYAERREYRQFLFDKYRVLLDNVLRKLLRYPEAFYDRSSRHRRVTMLREAVCWCMHNEYGLSYPAIAYAMHRDGHSSVVDMAARWERRDLGEKLTTHQTRDLSDETPYALYLRVVAAFRDSLNEMGNPAPEPDAGTVQPSEPESGAEVGVES